MGCVGCGAEINNDSDKISVALIMAIFKSNRGAVVQRNLQMLQS
jgi:hypothetical protein